MKKLRVAQVVCVFPPYAGGIGTAAANISKHLAKLGHDVTVFTPAYKPEYKRQEVVDGYKIERLPAKIKYGNAAVMNGLIKKLEKFDLIHLHQPFQGTAEAIFWAKKFGLKNLPVVSHYHMDLFGRNLLTKSVFYIEQRMIIPAELRASTKVIASSKDYLVRSKIGYLYKNDPEHFEIIPYGIDTNIFYPAQKDKRLVQKYDLEKKKVIIFVGGLDDAHYFKGVNHLLEAFAKLKNNDKYRLIVVGKGNLKESYKKMAADLGIVSKVIFAGFVSDDDLPKYYNLADISTLPSINSAEAFGIVLLEAMACGKPTVASQLPGVREVYGKGQEMISVRPGNSDDLAKKLELILTDQKLYDKISQENLVRIKKDYSWESIADRLNKLYEEITSK
ncbi:MAG: glycosyltransferase family 4 protein [Patescibacteria group bacterium]|jgi:glycosyltransferase involved in cell wall biosynthesis